MRYLIGCIVSLALATSPAFAEVPSLLRYQGILQDAEGKPVPTGSYQVIFRFYETEATPMANALHSEEHTVTCDEGGLFSVLLGGGEYFSSPASERPYWLGIEVESEGVEVSPRHQISSSAYARRSAVAEVALNATAATDADTVDGYQAAELLDRSRHTGTIRPQDISPQGSGSGIDADRLRSAAPGSGNGLDADSVDGWSSGPLMTRSNHIGTQAPSTISPQGAGSGLDADTVDTLHAASTPAGGKLLALDGAGKFPIAAIPPINKETLKTAVGEISVTGTGGVFIMSTLPGGEYGFYPQFKTSDTRNQAWEATFLGDRSRGINGFTNYVTNIHLRANDSGTTLYVRQRYITSSGTDDWVFVLLEKATGEILAIYHAMDHPSYGNGGDPKIVTHPFMGENLTKREIVLLDKASIANIKNDLTGNQTLVAILNEDYKIDLTSEIPYEPLHSGRFLGGEPEMIESLPDFVSVRRAVPLSHAEKSERALRSNITQAKHSVKEAQRNRIENSVTKKLANMGLTSEEINELLSN